MNPEAGITKEEGMTIPFVLARDEDSIIRPRGTNCLQRPRPAVYGVDSYGVYWKRLTWWLFRREEYQIDVCVSRQLTVVECSVLGKGVCMKYCTVPTQSRRTHTLVPFIFVLSL